MPTNTNPSRKVSVIIPTYNRSQLLRLTVESVLAQTYPNIEIIVIDDGSTDDTQAVMAGYAGQVIYIKQEHRAAYTRNAGFEAASGEYINFLDHDDLMLPTKIERQVQVLDSRPEIGLVHCGYYHIDKDGNILEKISAAPESNNLRTLVCGSDMWSGAPLIRRECLDQVGLFDRKLWCSDTDMWIRIALAGYSLACIPEPLGAYRILPDSEMSNVAGLEAGGLALLNKVFADPRLPADVAAGKDQVYAEYYFLTSCRYYAAYSWEDAQRNLIKALALKPDWQAQPESLLRDLDHNALNLRVGDPVKFVTGMFDHLPPEAEWLARYRARLLGHVQTGLALRDYGNGKLVEAKGRLAGALTAYPALLENTDEFAGLLSHHAVKLCVNDPFAYVETVLQNLPDGAQPLARARSRVLSDVNLAFAFQDYSTGRRREVLRRVWAASRARPACLRNRGVRSIFLKSLWPAPIRPSQV